MSGLATILRSRWAELNPWVALDVVAPAFRALDRAVIARAASAPGATTCPDRARRASAPQHHEFLRLVINSIRNDITSRNDTFQALGLVLVSNGAPGRA
jgi:hypothetical protein